LPGDKAWDGIRLSAGKFYMEDDSVGINEWHLLNRYKKRFNVEGTSSTRGLQAIYVAAGVGANESLARLLLDRTDAELAEVGTVAVAVEEPRTPIKVRPPIGEPPLLERKRRSSLEAVLERLHEKEAALQAELNDLDHATELYERIQDLEARVQEALCYAPLDDEASLRRREADAEEELERLERLTKRSEDLDIRLGRARTIWCYEELADGEPTLAKREQEAAEEMAELEVLMTRVMALRALEKKVEEARKVLDLV
jgi:hypothetical protein